MRKWAECPVRGTAVTRGSISLPQASGARASSGSRSPELLTSHLSLWTYRLLALQFSETTNHFTIQGFSRAGDTLAAFPSNAELSSTAENRRLWGVESQSVRLRLGLVNPCKGPQAQAQDTPRASTTYPTWPAPLPRPSSPFQAQLDAVAQPFCPVPPRAAASNLGHVIVWLQPKQSSCCGISGIRDPVREALGLCIPPTLLTPKVHSIEQDGPPHPQAGSPLPGTAAPKDNVIP